MSHDPLALAFNLSVLEDCSLKARACFSITQQQLSRQASVPMAPPQPLFSGPVFIKNNNLVKNQHCNKAAIYDKRL